MDLTRARPHVHDSAHFTPATYRTYSEGYYRGVVAALQVTELAVERFKLRTKTLAAETRRKRSA